jgi:hypothetical protein
MEVDKKHVDPSPPFEPCIQSVYRQDYTISFLI